MNIIDSEIYQKLCIKPLLFGHFHKNIEMGKARRSRKRMGKRARRLRIKIAFCVQKENPAVQPQQEEECPSVQPQEESQHTRVILSTKAIEDAIELAVNHAKVCENAQFLVDGHGSKLLKITCSICKTVHTSPKDSDIHQLPLNDAIAAGALCSGLGYASLKTLFSSMEIPLMANGTYISAEERIGEKIYTIMHEDFKKNGELERQLAIDAGDFIEIDGEMYPFITVIVDGGWAKRSYGHSYKSNAGVAVIIGCRTKNILWMGCKVKTCSICDKKSEESQLSDSQDASTENDQLNHTCYKNWNDSSQAMEAAIIVEGFRKSIADHGLIYKYLVGDADSSVYAKIQSEVIYPGRTPVEKIDCINHAVRALNSKIYSIISTTSYAKKDRDTISQHVNRFGKDIKAAVAYNHKNQNRELNPTSAMSLSEDIINTPCHILEDHSKCKPYFCQTVGQASSTYSIFSKTPAGKELILAFHRLANRSQRLIYNITSNFAECFMGIMTKCIAGKRINFAERGSYNRRACSAVMAYNRGAYWLDSVLSHDGHSCKIWEDTFSYFKRQNTRTSRKRKWTHGSGVTNKEKFAYGTQAFHGTFSNEEMKSALQRLEASLQLSPDQCIEIEKLTIGQSFNELWKAERRNRLTASNCGRIFSLQPHTDNTSILKTLLYPTDLSKNENIKNGINLEPEAKRMYEFLNGVVVQECGLQVSRENGILASSSDGKLPDDGLLEVKCITCEPEKVPERADKFLVRKIKNDPTSGLMLKKTHKYYYQILMQLHVTGRKYCDFFVYHKPKDESTNLTWFQERIYRTEETAQLWEKVSDKLISFYRSEVAPEIVNPIFHQTGKFRMPEFRKSAIDKKQAEKQTKVPKQ